MPWKDYKDLLVWQKSMDLVDEIYKLISLLPESEKYALSSQMRRAAVSVPSNIAEGNARFSEKDFKHFLQIAKGSLYELDTQLMICERQRYLSSEQVKQVMLLTDEIIKMLSKIIVRLEASNN